MWHVWGGTRTGAYSLSVGRHEGKRHLEDPGIEGMVLQEVGLGEMDWIDLA